MNHWNEGRPVGVHLYDLDSLAREFSEERVKEFVEAATTTDVLEARRIETAHVSINILTWTNGTPNMTSYRTLHEQWEGLKPEKKARLEEVLDALGRHQLDGWLVA